MENDVLVSIGKENYTTQIQYGNLSLLADEPTELGGSNQGFAPTQLLLSSIGSCKAITMKMYANRKKWEIQNIDIKLSLETKKGDLQQTTYIKCNIFISGDLADDQKQRLYNIAEKCPIHKILQNPIIIESNLITTK